MRAGMLVLIGIVGLLVGCRPQANSSNANSDSSAAPAASAQDSPSRQGGASSAAASDSSTPRDSASAGNPSSASHTSAVHASSDSDLGATSPEGAGTDPSPPVRPGESESAITSTPSAEANASGADKPVADESRASENVGAETKGQGGHDGEAQPMTPLYVDWPTPRFVLAFCGRQHGYIEPCGCTGLANQKGGLARRHSFLRDLADKGWPTVPLDVGNQVRRFGRQAEIKFQITVEGLKKMGFGASTFGPDDLRLTIDELAATTAQVAENETAFVSANVAILDRGFTPRFRVIQVGDKRVGVIGALGEENRNAIRADEILTEPTVEGVKVAWEQLSKAGGCDYAVLLMQGTRDETLEVARAVPHFDVVATSGGGEEPTLVPEKIPDTKSILIQVGAKGMYAGVVGFFDDAQTPWRYQRVPLDSRFPDSPEMLQLLATYQQQLEQQGFEGLGVRPLVHPSGRKFVGSRACAGCHSQASDVWEGTLHAQSTETLVHPSERQEIARHFDPECLSCHVTGWNPQRHTPYESGYLSLLETPKMVAVGCENCHGPGSAHVGAETGATEADDATMSRLREEMRLVLADAERKCLECHDLDNSPDFHVPGAFQKYWSQVAHPGKK